ncbi:MAG: hypothetical protein KJ884_17875 [Gammaproteobacteria bacterium]|nr:hypothetical protein [Gammaproteobacteria bacterium]MBU2138488.1 hypothetical protein [Gammaproteobacteria bacterium]MBU2324820.1 hypothetical protein [Gammaproteobacteria bacterium]
MNDTSPYAIACHFCVSHINGATIPATRLSKILEQIFHQQPLTALQLGYLHQLKLTELHKLASGQIGYDAFIAALDPALVAAEQNNKAEHQASQERRQAQASAWADEARRKRESAKAARIARETKQRETTRTAEKARISLEIESAKQCEENRRVAEARYSTMLSQPGFRAPTPGDIARHYRIKALPEAVTSPLRNILEALYQGRPLSPAYLNYLRLKFRNLHDLAAGHTSYEAYLAAIAAAEAAQEAKIEQAKNQERLHQEAQAARIARENDPAYLLRKKYGVFTCNQALLPKLMSLLEKIDNGNRLDDDDVVWLNTAAKQHFTDELKRTHNEREAEFYAAEYHRTQDPWNAINASGHYRKCQQAQIALELLISVPANSYKQPKIYSALCTTHGGVMRDLGRRHEALELGTRGHELQPRNFRPCTLLGAVNMELGNFAEGHSWYTQAEERGASKQSIDTELKGIFRRADKASREKMKESLLAEDPQRYSWVNEKYRTT